MQGFCIRFPDTSLFSVSAASPDNPAVHGDPGEPAFYCRVGPSHPGCVPAVLCSAGLIIMFLPFLLSWNNCLIFDGLNVCFLVVAFHFLKETGRRARSMTLPLVALKGKYCLMTAMLW